MLKYNVFILHSQISEELGIKPPNSVKLFTGKSKSLS